MAFAWFFGRHPAPPRQICTIQLKLSRESPFEGFQSLLIQLGEFTVPLIVAQELRVQRFGTGGIVLGLMSEKEHCNVLCTNIPQQTELWTTGCSHRDNYDNHGDDHESANTDVPFLCKKLREGAVHEACRRDITR